MIRNHNKYNIQPMVSAFPKPEYLKTVPSLRKRTTVLSKLCEAQIFS